ncbi:baseplate assembly protein [Rhizobium tumorigenes]|uniref:baseplate assembly protein n=1 Tax=Rhizobium tumorigenes TaxID=2041385 RepID=UPI00241D6F0F|nr:baseplate J/gp47 family protein [Rhizobium tumorigenes]WFS02773.1 baseplate J/gp47 family protein [Rhizobium tumorigenes]
MLSRLNAAGVDFDVANLETDPLIITEEHAAFYDLLLTGRVNDAVLAYAKGADLDQKAAELGVERKVLIAADTTVNPPIVEVLESDDSLRRRRQLVIEAFSTAGPEGAYVFFALASHPHVSDVAVYDPNSGLANDGEALCVVASSQGDGVPTDAVLDSVADFLDARIIRYAVTADRTRQITRRQKLRPLTDKVIVEACEVLDYSITVLLKIPFGPDPASVVALAQTRLTNYLASRRQISRLISDTAIASAVHVADTDGVPLVDDANIVITVAGSPVSDVTPGPKQLARCVSAVVTYQVIQ